jgi:hypothetical protein
MARGEWEVSVNWNLIVIDPDKFRAVAVKLTPWSLRGHLTPTSFRNLAVKLACAALGLAIGLWIVRPVFATGSSCFQENKREPVEGKWKGFFRLTYQMKYPVAAPPMNLKWEGDLDFIIGRTQVPHESTYVWAPPCLRVPAGSKNQPAEGCDRNGNRIGPPAPLPIQYSYDKPHFSGIGKASMSFDFQMTRNGVNIKNPVMSQEPAQLDTKEELGQSDAIVALLLMGSPKQFKYLSSFMAHSGSGTVQENAQLSGSGEISGNTVARSKDGGYGTQHIQSDGNSRANVHSEATSADGKHYEEDSSIRTSTGTLDEWKQMFRLKLEEQDCWLMKGTVDTTEMKKSIESSGMHMENVQSEWIATLEERDMEFEKAIERFAQEPIPANLTWDYVNNATATYQQLVGDKPSNYRLCVASKAADKMGRISELAMRTLLNSHPLGQPGATRAVVDASLQRILELFRIMNFFGASEDCPLMKEAKDLGDKAYQQRWVATH